MLEEKSVSNLIRYTLNYLKVLEHLQEKGATEKDLDRFTTRFYEKAINEAAHQGIDREYAMQIILSVLTGGAVRIPTERERKREKY